MKKIHIVHNIDIDTTELELYFDVYTSETEEEIQTRYNPYFKSTWGDFDWIRSLFNVKTDIRCFVTSKEKLNKAGVVGHIGMYDLIDNDGVIDFYAGIPSKLDRRAKENGFKTNLAFLCVHEYLHGREQGSGTPDRVHEMERQGKLKDLYLEYSALDFLYTVSLIKKIRNLLIELLNRKRQHDS